jgi:Zn-finger nucleic acid-binding protein
MKCPVDSSDLTISDRQGVEIDFCPTCRGVWLDRGELDKIIERAGAYDRDRGDSRGRDRRDDDDYDDDDNGIGGLLGRLFGG